MVISLLLKVLSLGLGLGLGFSEEQNKDICVKLRERTPIKEYRYLCSKCIPIGCTFMCSLFIHQKGCTCMCSIHEFIVTSYEDSYGEYLYL